MASSTKPPHGAQGERRGSDRRYQGERREEIRFEPGKQDRRQGERRKRSGWDKVR